MNRLLIILLLASFFHPKQLCAQADSAKGNAYVLWLLPSAKKNIYGISIGLIGSETICNIKGTKKSHGVNFQLFGQGIFVPFNRKSFSYKNTMQNDSSFMVRQYNPANFRAQHNGILISGFGTWTEASNGIVISGLSSLGYVMNGIAFNLLSSKYTKMNGISVSINNEAYEVKGMQIGLINRTNKLSGVQFGLWNVSGKRKLPILNWGL
jgi:hypothetical protein